MTVPLGLLLAEPPAPWTELGALGGAAEAAGAASVWLTDHLFWHRPTVDLFSALALLAANTTSATVGPCVAQLPLRDPASVAKSTAFLDALAPGRVVLGVGAGEHLGEYEAAGHAARFGERGVRSDRGIAAIRAAWQGEGRYAMDPSCSAPIWVGGRSPAARRRAARLGDGWIPHLIRSGPFRRGLAELARDLDDAGRSDQPFTRAAVVAVAVDGIAGPSDGSPSDPASWFGQLYDLPPERFRRSLVRGSASEVATELAAFEAAGADHLVVMPGGTDPVDQLAAIAEALGGRGPS
jgi:alkanesulfonate monooxygenase SsuD/methylene tetrahydromethanopterin reductase-like flavin-dependent oxidoreductase (luciferase family)